MTVSVSATSQKNFTSFKLWNVVRLKNPLSGHLTDQLLYGTAYFKAVCGETRLEYYWRCFRIVTGKPQSGDLGETIVCKSYSHLMKAARILCNKYYGANVRTAGVYWINVMFFMFYDVGT